MGQEFAGFGFDAAFAQGGAGVVIGSFAFEGGAEVFDAYYVDEEIGKLEGSFLQIFDCIVDRRVVEKFGVVIAYEADAGGAGAYDIVGSGKISQEFGADIPGIVAETGVESRLSATGLFGVITNGYACLFEDADHIESGLGKELIDETRYE
jgi:hypothetical protein